MTTENWGALRELVHAGRDVFALDALLRRFSDGERGHARDYALRQWELEQDAFDDLLMRLTLELVLDQPVDERWRDCRFQCFIHVPHNADTIRLTSSFCSFYESDELRDALEMIAARRLLSAFDADLELDDVALVRERVFHRRERLADDEQLLRWTAGHRQRGVIAAERHEHWRRVLHAGHKIADPWFHFLLLELSSPISAPRFVRREKSSRLMRSVTRGFPELEFLIGWENTSVYDHDEAFCLIAVAD